MDNRKFVAIESTTCFNFCNLLAKIRENIKKKYPDLKGKSYSDLTLKSLKTFKLNDQEFEFKGMDNYLGGVRWFVLCPECHRNSQKLFLPSAHKDRKQLYLCKICHRLKNSSLLIGTSKRYKKVVKPLRHLEKIRAMLLKKNMTPEKAQPYLDEYKRIESELSSSPEYRLWRFQKEHGIVE